MNSLWDGATGSEIASEAGKMTETLIPKNAWLCLSGHNHNESPFTCAITGHPCEGDLSHLCEEYGCARKGGLSPRSDENL